MYNLHKVALIWGASTFGSNEDYLFLGHMILDLLPRPKRHMMNLYIDEKGYVDGGGL